MEHLHVRSSTSRAKSLGTLIAVSGAFVIALYKGPSILLHMHMKLDRQMLQFQLSNWILGGFIIAVTYVISAIWNILQEILKLGNLIMAMRSWPLYMRQSIRQFSGVTWCLQKKGPLFVAMFKPLGMVIAVIMGTIFLGDILHFGSVIGGLIVAAGFYTVMWGQAKEDDMIPKIACGGESSALNKPLLHRGQSV